MLKPVHAQITRKGLAGKFSARALAAIVGANLKQDRFLALIGHDEFHFDSNAFARSYTYLEEQRRLTRSALEANHVPSAWSAFGRLIHTAQDFYAHSNYIDLWLALQPEGTQPSPADVDPLHPDLIHAPALRSGKVYTLELLTFIPGLKSLAMSLLPRDAHGWMNIDSPERSSNFPYAFQAALKRTRIEYRRTTENLPGDLVALFVGK